MSDATIRTTPVMLEPIQPRAWPRPLGYANGMLSFGRGERVLFVAGQVGWNAASGAFESDDLAAQFARALENVIAVVQQAGGTPQCIGRMTVYVTDLEAYRRSTRAIGEAWRAQMGKHYPAMSLVGVAALLEPRAKVEIEATCVLAGFAEEP